MSQSVTVSVVIPTFGRSGPLRRALLSVVQQEFSNYEIVVVDDNVSPSLQIEVKNICVELGARYIGNTGSKGGCGARNTGALNASGKYLAFLDDDDCWFENKLEEQINFMESLGSSASFSGFFVYYEDQELAVEPKRSGAKEILTREDILKGNCPATTSLAIICRELFLAVGSFDVDLPSFQDYDLWLRLSEYTEIHYLAMPLVVFTFHSGDRVSVNLDKRFSGLEIIIDKWKSEISYFEDLRLIKRKFKASAYEVNALTLSDSSYLKSMKFRLLSIWEYPFNIRSYFNLLLSILGGRVYWRLLKFRHTMKKCNGDKIKKLYITR